MTGALQTGTAVAVIGAGTMGSGIALVAAQAGHPVLLYDADASAGARALASLRASLDRQTARGKIDAGQAQAIADRIVAVDAIEDLAAAGLVIEAIVETIGIKAGVLAKVENVVGPDTILATNTSSLSITALAARLARPERVIGMHFFNPAPVLPLVEVVSGHATDAQVADCIFETARAWGKLPVRCGSTPGFIVNRVARPFYGEALRLLAERAGDPATIDAILCECGGFRMGPFALMDLIGHDVNLAVTSSVYRATFDDPRYRPSLVQQALVDAGWLGRKSGRGFFDYALDAVQPQPRSAPTADAPSRVGLAGDCKASALLADMARAKGITVEAVDDDGPAGHRIGAAILSLTDGRMAAASAAASGRPTILFDLSLDYRTAARIALSASDECADADRAAASGLFQHLGMAVSWLDDAPGLAVARTVAMLVNEAAEALHQGVASAADIDLSMQKGVNYPFGPLAAADAIGSAYFAAVMDNLADAYRDPRYRCSPLLRRKALSHGRFHEGAA